MVGGWYVCGMGGGGGVGGSRLVSIRNTHSVIPLYPLDIHSSC